MTTREFRPEAVTSILVLRLYFIGDVLLSTPVFEALKRRFPDASLTVMVKRRAAEVLEGNPHVDEVMVYDAVERYHSPRWVFRLATELRRRRFSLAVDLTGDLRSSWLLFASDPGFRVGVNHAGFSFLLDRRIDYVAPGHVVDHLLTAVEPVGAAVADASPRIYLSDSERDEAAVLLKGAGLEPSRGVLALAPGANWPSKRWLPERFGRLAALAREKLGLKSVVLGSHDDEGLAEAVVESSVGAAVSLAGRTSLRQLAAIAASSLAFVGNDSGPVHVAAAVGTPVVALFGPIPPERFAPRGAPVRALSKRLECSPCSHRECPREDETCMDALGVDEVFEALRSLLEEGGRA